LILNISYGLQIRLDQFDSGSRLQTCGTSPADESLQGFLLWALDAERLYVPACLAGWAPNLRHPIVHLGMKKPRACLGN